MPHHRRIEGYAIVSEDGMLANASGIMPDQLKFEADQLSLLKTPKTKEVLEFLRHLEF